MFKKVTSLLCVTIFVIALMGVTASAEDTTVLKYGHIWASESHMHEAVQLAADLIEQRSDGRLKLNIYPGGQLGSQFEGMENVKQGNQDMTMVWGIDRYCPKFKIFNTPYVYRDHYHQYNVVMESALGEKYIRNPMLEEHGIRLVGMLYHGARMLTTSCEHPVNSLEDVEGLKLRTPDITAWINAWEEAGANVTAFPWGELYMGLKQGTVDAQENPLTSIKDMKFYEVQDQVILTSHIVDYPIVMINEETYQSLDSELQDILVTAFEQARKYSIAAAQSQNEKNLKLFKDEGLDVVEIDTSEWAEIFTKAVSNYEDGEEIYQKIQEVK